MSPEEIKAAQSKLDAAVEEFVQAMKWSQSEGLGGLVLTSWVLCGHQMGWSDDGESRSAYITIYKEGDQPDHVIDGLLRLTLARIERRHAEADAVDDDD